MIIRFDKQLSSPEIINNYIYNYERLKKIDFVEDTPYQIFHKIYNEDFYNFLFNLGKSTHKFLTDIVKKQLMKASKPEIFKRLRDYICDKEKCSIELASEIVKYYISLYINSRENLRKALFFLLWNEAKANSKYMEAETILLKTNVVNYILYKDNMTEDGEFPKKKDELDFTETIEEPPTYIKKLFYSDIVLDKYKQEELIEIFEDQIHLLDDENTIETLINVAKKIGLNITLD